MIRTSERTAHQFSNHGTTYSRIGRFGGFPQHHSNSLNLTLLIDLILVEPCSTPSWWLKPCWSTNWDSTPKKLYQQTHVGGLNHVKPTNNVLLVKIDGPGIPYIIIYLLLKGFVLTPLLINQPVGKGHLWNPRWSPQHLAGSPHGSRPRWAKLLPSRCSVPRCAARGGRKRHGRNCSSSGRQVTWELWEPWKNDKHVIVDGLLYGVILVILMVKKPLVH